MIIKTMICQDQKTDQKNYKNNITRGIEKNVLQ